MKTTILIVCVLASIGWASTGRIEASREVYSSYMARSDYLQEVKSGTKAYSMAMDEGLGIELQNACDKLAKWTGRDDPSACRLNMAFWLGFKLK